MPPSSSPFVTTPEIVTEVPIGMPRATSICANAPIVSAAKAQERIVAYLDEQRIWKDDNSRYTKLDLSTVTDPEFKEQFRQWSSFETLLIIFESFQVSSGDLFQEKKLEYTALRNGARTRSALRLDQDGDGELDITPYDIRTTRMVRR